MATVERTDQGLQIVIAGTERSARQAAQRREVEGKGKLRAKVVQRDPGGLFAYEAPQKGLFD